MPRVAYRYKCHRKVKEDILPLKEHIVQEYKLDFDLDRVDIEILVLITKGHSSPYSIWASMKKEAKTKNLEKKVMTYKNINKRVIRLLKTGLIEETKPDAHTVNLHGRKDYKLNIKSLPYLVHDTVIHAQNVQNMAEYLDKIKLDKRFLAKLLDDYSASAIYAANLYRKTIGLTSAEYGYKVGRYTHFKSVRSK